MLYFCQVVYQIIVRKLTFELEVMKPSFRYPVISSISWCEAILSTAGRMRWSTPDILWYTSLQLFNFTKGGPYANFSNTGGS